MTARGTIVLLVIGAAAMAPVCVPLSVFLGLCALMVAIGWEWDQRRGADARQRSRPPKYFQARRVR